jgi:hypothetical protein
MAVPCGAGTPAAMTKVSVGDGGRWNILAMTAGSLLSMTSFRMEQKPAPAVAGGAVTAAPIVNSA